MNIEEKLAAVIKEHNETYFVRVDGGLHRLPEPVIIPKTSITRKLCKQLAAQIAARYDVDVKVLEIDLTEYDFSGITPEIYELVLSGDAGVPRRGPIKEVEYKAKCDTLVIWENGNPVYMNARGDIIRDEAALADCLM